jgi:hypothetical protein
VPASNPDYDCDAPAIEREASEKYLALVRESFKRSHTPQHESPQARALSIYKGADPHPVLCCSALCAAIRHPRRRTCVFVFNHVEKVEPNASAHYWFHQVPSKVPACHNRTTC